MDFIGMHSKQNPTEIARAKDMLRSLKEKLEQLTTSANEKRAEMLDLDHRHHKLEATGDINKMMAVKQRSMALSKAIGSLMTSKAECLSRLDATERYIETLNRRLDRLCNEDASLVEKLAARDLSPEAAIGLKTARSRLRMQIEALAGPQRNTASLRKTGSLKATGSLKGTVSPKNTGGLRNTGGLKKNSSALKRNSSSLRKRD